MLKCHPSVLDNDQYKFTIQKAVIELFPNERVQYTFFNRRGVKFPPGFGGLLRDKVDAFAEVKMLPEERENINSFLISKGITFFDPAYLEFLKNFRYDPREVTISQEGGDLKITIEGYWYRTILWEVPLMAAISELYFEIVDKDKAYSVEQRTRINTDKIFGLYSIGAKFVEFGTRRRYSYANHDRVLKDFTDAMASSGSLHDCFLGTSNLHFAMKYDLKPKGTVAHEFYSFHAAKYGPAMATTLALENWVKVFKGDLGIALPDTFTTPVFLRSFNKVLARIYDGIRQDSGDPMKFVDLMHKHYLSLGINPQTKTVMFSDNLKSLDVIRAVIEYCKNKMIPTQGLGTWLTNDMGVAPLDMVIKLTGLQVNGKLIPAIKLSDTAGKHTGDESAIEFYKRTLGI